MNKNYYIFSEKPIFPCDQKLPCSKKRNDKACFGCGYDCFMTSDINHKADGVIPDEKKRRLIPYFIEKGTANDEC